MAELLGAVALPSGLTARAREQARRNRAIAAALAADPECRFARTERTAAIRATRDLMAVLAEWRI